MAKVLFIVSGATYWVLKDGTRYATGYWAEEFAHPYKILTDAGHEVVVATPNGVTPNVDMMSLRPEMAGGVQGALDLEAIIRSAEVMRRPLKLSDVRLEDYDAVYVPGGHGPMSDLAFDADVGRLLTAQLASGNPLFIVCHGPASMLATRIHGVSPFKGYRITCFTNKEEEAVGPGSQGDVAARDRHQGKGRCRVQLRGELEALHGRGPKSGHRAEPRLGHDYGKADAGGPRRERLAEIGPTSWLLGPVAQSERVGEATSRRAADYPLFSPVMHRHDAGLQARRRDEVEVPRALQALEQVRPVAREDRVDDEWYSSISPSRSSAAESMGLPTSTPCGSSP